MRPTRAFAARNSKKSSWPVTDLWNRGCLKILNGIKLILDDQGNHKDSCTINQFGIIHVPQRSPILQTSNWLGTFFAVSYNKQALMIFFSYFCSSKINQVEKYVD